MKLRLAVCLAFLSGCPATVGKTGLVQIPSDAAQTCSSLCSEIGLELSAVAIMASNVGCVCQPATTTPSARSATGIAGGMTTIMLEEQRSQQQHAAN